MTDDKRSLWFQLTDLNPPGWPLILVFCIGPVLWPVSIYLLYRRVKFNKSRDTRLPENRLIAQSKIRGLLSTVVMAVFILPLGFTNNRGGAWMALGCLVLFIFPPCAAVAIVGIVKGIKAIRILASNNSPLGKSIIALLLNVCPFLLVTFAFFATENDWHNRM